MGRNRYFDNYCYGVPMLPHYDVADKELSVRNFVGYMLSRTQKMFRWTNLPDTIPERNLELFLQTHGNVCFAEYKGDLFVFVGGLGGEPNPYYMPTKCVVANPALKLSDTFTIDENCVVLPNDSMYMGLLPMLQKYASLIAETELTIKRAVINSRIYNLISASDDRTKASAEKFLKDVEDGKSAVIGENKVLEGLRSQPYGSTGTNVLTDLIETVQYLKASLFNELGLNANYNMKRESLNSAESQLNDDALLPLVDDMLSQRQLGAEKVNRMFGTNISVSLASAWEDNQEELDAEQEQISNQVESENKTEDGGDGTDEAEPSI